MSFERIFETQPDALLRLGQSVGTDDFYAACHDLMADLVAYDGKWNVIYSRVARPRTISYELAPSPSVKIDKDLVRSVYDLGFYRFGPFFRYWQNGGAPGVVRMHEFPVPPSKENTYLTNFMPITRMTDEVAVLLRVSDYECVALTLDRSTEFSGDELATLRSLYPLLAGLSESHLRATSWKDSHDDGANQTPPLDFGSSVNSFTSSRFTPRERDIVHLILGGFSNDAIARRIAISVGTVRNHRKRLYTKMDITTERELFSLFLGHLAETDPAS